MFAFQKVFILTLTLISYTTISLFINQLINALVLARAAANNGSAVNY